MKKNKIPEKVEFVDDSKFVKCDCWGHLLEVRREMEIVNGKITHKNFEVCVWDRYGDSHQPLSWRERIRWCWQVLRKGTTWKDQVVISDKKAKILAQFILSNLSKKHKTTKK